MSALVQDAFDGAFGGSGPYDFGDSTTTGDIEGSDFNGGDFGYKNGVSDVVLLVALGVVVGGFMYVGRR